MAHNQPQMSRHDRSGALRRLCRVEALAAVDQTQGGRVAFVGPSVLRLTSSLYNSGGLRLPHFSQFSLLGGTPPPALSDDSLEDLEAEARALATKIAAKKAGLRLAGVGR